MMRSTSPSISLLSVFVHPPCSLHALGYVQCEPMHTHWCKLLLLGNNLRKEKQEKMTPHKLLAGIREMSIWFL